MKADDTGSHYCVDHQGDFLHHAKQNCALCVAHKELARLRAEVASYEEREAACCPEDRGFDAVIKGICTNNERLREEVERLNKMRVHCPDCGGDYMQTGIETGCPCRLRAEVERLREIHTMATMLWELELATVKRLRKTLDKIRWLPRFACDDARNLSSLEIAIDVADEVLRFAKADAMLAESKKEKGGADAK